jgi:hypothetical protein
LIAPPDTEPEVGLSDEVNPDSQGELTSVIAGPGFKPAKFGRFGATVWGLKVAFHSLDFRHRAKGRHPRALAGTITDPTDSGDRMTPL